MKRIETNSCGGKSILNLILRYVDFPFQLQWLDGKETCTTLFYVTLLSPRTLTD